MRKRLLTICLVLSAGALFLSGLGRFALKDYDEATYALVASEMIESRNYLYFTHSGKPWLDKPPLLFWLMGGSASLFGFNEFSLRLPGALIGIATVLLTFAFAKSLSNSRLAGLLSAGILLTTAQFVYSAREVRFDVPVGFGILLAVYSFYRAWEKPIWYMGVSTGIALAILFKSVVAIFIPLLFLIFAFTHKEWRWLRQPYFWLSLLSGLLLVAPWHILQYQKHGELFLNTYLGRHGFARYSDPFLGARNANPLYFIVLGARLIEPWFLLLTGGAIWCLVKSRAEILKKSEWRQALWASFFSVALIIGAFSFSKSKLFYYFDPVYPFLAVFLALFLISWQKKLEDPRKKIYAAVIGVFLLFGLANTVWQIAEVRGWPRGAGEYALTSEERAVSEILNAQTASTKLYTMLHFYWDTIRFYTRDRAVPVEINALGETIDADAFFLLIPTVVLKSIDIHPLILERLETAFAGQHLTLFLVQAVKPTTQGQTLTGRENR